VEGLDAHAQGFGEGRSAGRHDHELLQVDVVVRVHAAVEDIHHRHRQDLGIAAADVLVEGQAEGFGRSLGRGQRDRQGGVGAQFGLVGRAVQFDQDLVDESLLGGVLADHFVGDDIVDILHRLEHTLAFIAGGIAVAQLDRFMFAGGCAGGYCSAPHSAAFKGHIHFDSGVAAGVENFTCKDINNGGHASSLFALFLKPISHKGTKDTKWNDPAGYPCGLAAL